MPSLSELKKQRDKLRKKDELLREAQKLKSEIFEMKHGRKIRFLKKAGSVAGRAVKSTGKGFARYAEYYDKNSRQGQTKQMKRKKRIKSQKRNDYGVPFGYDGGGSLF